jgi:putative restriction endonuclease
MEFLATLLERVPSRHRVALQWFIDNAGKEVPWPNPSLPDGTLLVSRAKGIYKPTWTEYALSIRLSLGRPYPDRELIARPDDGLISIFARDTTRANVTQHSQIVAQ